MADRAWSSGRDARAAATVQRVAAEVTAPLARGYIRPLVAARRSGKTWMLRALEHACRTPHGAMFHDLDGADGLPTPGPEVKLWLLDEPGRLLATRSGELVAWARAQAGRVVIAMTPDPPQRG